MKVVAVDFVRSAAGPGDFPRERWPQVAFVGRSNVGKSSLLNALTRRSVARTSAKPGKTRLLNVYRLRAEGFPAPNLFLVDLPGYGYARGGAESRQAFDTLVETYFAHPPAPAAGAPGSDNTPGPYGPTASVLLVDARHPGLDADVAAVGWLQANGRPFVVAASKIDKLTRAERQRAEREFADAFHVPIVPVSASTGEGLNELWTEIKQRLSGPSA